MYHSKTNIPCGTYTEGVQQRLLQEMQPKKMGTEVVKVQRERRL